MDVDFERTWSTETMFEYSKYWLNYPAKEYSSQQIGFNLNCLIEALMISRIYLDNYEGYLNSDKAVADY